jgi:hypothetical protein
LEVLESLPMAFLKPDFDDTEEIEAAVSDIR